MWYHTLVAAFLEWAEWAQSSGLLGMFVVGCVTVLTSATPFPGYGTMLLVCGFCFGYLGFAVSFISALLGAALGFTLGRYFIRARILNLIRRKEKLQAVDRMLSQGSLWTLFLFRMAPYPFALVSYAFAVSGVTFRRFLLATTLSLPKQLIHVSVGHSLRSLKVALTEGVGHWWELAFLSVAILTSALLGLLVMRALREVKAAALHPEPCHDVELLSVSMNEEDGTLRAVPADDPDDSSSGSRCERSPDAEPTQPEALWMEGDLGYPIGEAPGEAEVALWPQTPVSPHKFCFAEDAR